MNHSYNCGHYWAPVDSRELRMLLPTAGGNNIGQSVAGVPLFTQINLDKYYEKSFWFSCSVDSWGLKEYIYQANYMYLGCTAWPSLEVTVLTLMVNLNKLDHPPTLALKEKTFTCRSLFIGSVCAVKPKCCLVNVMWNNLNAGNQPSRLKLQFIWYIYIYI